MIGLNKLVLNERTMIEAVQIWLDSKMIHLSPTVTSVKPNPVNSYEHSFEITIDSDAERDPGPEKQV